MRPGFGYSVLYCTIVGEVSLVRNFIQPNVQAFRLAEFGEYLRGLPIKSNTVETYSAAASRLAVWAVEKIGRSGLADLTLDDLRTYLLPSTPTYNHVYFKTRRSNLKPYITWLTEYLTLFPSNPMDEIRLPRPCRSPRGSSMEDSDLEDWPIIYEKLAIGLKNGPAKRRRTMAQPVEAEAASSRIPSATPVRPVTSDEPKRTQRQIIASLGGLTTRARHDPKEYTAKARAAFMGRWLKEVNERTPGLPEAERHKRAEALKKAHFRAMVLKRHRGT